jgi:hypothetical protein
MIDFPANPTVGQTFTAAGVTWTYDGAKWTLGPSAPNLITVSDTPPPNPSQGALWWESVNGQMYVFYNDGSSSQWAPTTNQMGGGYMPLQGVTDGSDAKPGQIGEVISSAIATPGVTLPTGAWSVITNIPLTAGDWDVQGEVWTAGSPTGIILISGAVSPNNGTPPLSGISAARNTIGGTLSGAQAIPLRTCRVSVSATTPYYLAGLATFSSGTYTAYGNIWARRTR